MFGVGLINRKHNLRMLHNSTGLLEQSLWHFEACFSIEIYLRN